MKKRYARPLLFLACLLPFSSIALCGLFSLNNPFKTTQDDAVKKFTSIKKEIGEAEDKLLKKGLVGNPIRSQITTNQKADSAYSKRTGGADATPDIENAVVADPQTAKCPTTPTNFYAFARRESTNADLNEVETSINLRGLLETIDDQVDNLKKYKYLRVKTALSSLESDIAESRTKYAAFPDATNADGDTLDDLAKQAQTLHTRLSNEFQYCVQIAYTFCELQRQKPVINSAGEQSTDKSSNVKVVSKDDKATISALYESVENLDKAAQKYFSNNSITPLTKKNIQEAYDCFPKWFGELRTHCTDKTPLSKVDSDASPVNVNYANPFTIDLNSTTSYHEMPHKHALKAYDTMNRYLINCAKTIRNKVKEKDLFPTKKASVDSSSKAQPENLSGWPTNLFAVLAAYQNKVFLGGFGIVGTRWLLFNTILTEVAKQINNILDPLNMDKGKLKISLQDYKDTLKKLVAPKATAAPDAGGDSGPDTAKAVDRRTILAQQSFYRSWDYDDASAKSTLSAAGTQSTDQQKAVIDAVKKLSDDQRQNLSATCLNALISLTRLYRNHSKALIANAIIAIRPAGVTSATFVSPDDWSAYLELKVVEVAVYNLIALLKIVSTQKIYDKETHEAVRKKGDVANGLPALFKALEPLATIQAKNQIQSGQTHGNVQTETIASLTGLTNATGAITTYEQARTAATNNTPAEITNLLNTAAVAIAAQLSVALRLADIKDPAPAPDAATDPAAADSSDAGTGGTTLTLAGLAGATSKNTQKAYLASLKLPLPSNIAGPLFRSSAVKIQQFTRSLTQLQKYLSSGADMPADYTAISQPADTVLFSLRQTKTNTVAASDASDSEDDPNDNIYPLSDGAGITIAGADVNKFTIVKSNNTPALGVTAIYAKPGAAGLRFLVQMNGKKYLGGALLDGSNMPYPPDTTGTITIILDASAVGMTDITSGYKKKIFTQTPPVSRSEPDASGAADTAEVPKNRSFPLKNSFDTLTIKNDSIAGLNLAHVKAIYERKSPSRAFLLVENNLVYTATPQEDELNSNQTANVDAVQLTADISTLDSTLEWVYGNDDIRTQASGSEAIPAPAPGDESAPIDGGIAAQAAAGSDPENGIYKLSNGTILGILNSNQTGLKRMCKKATAIYNIHRSTVSVTGKDAPIQTPYLIQINNNTEVLWPCSYVSNSSDIPAAAKTVQLQQENIQKNLIQDIDTITSPANILYPPTAT